jgi:hypothetical protein
VIVKIIAGQRKGKGIVGVGIVLWLMAYGGYKPVDVCGNQSIYIEGYRKFTNDQLLGMLRVMVEQHVRGKVVYISEADRAFPPRFWHDSAQTHALIGLQQDEKLGNWFIYDTHWRGVDVLLDSASQYEVIPEYRPALDMVDVGIIKLQEHVPKIMAKIDNVSKRIFPYYDTHEPVD